MNDLPLISFPLIAGILGLLIGSFLNVVIVRYPRMRFCAWKQEALGFLQDQAPQWLTSSALSLKPETLTLPRPDNLIFPYSQCPHCHHPIRFRDNIPLLSFLWLKGRCRDCKTPIGWRYPLVELLSALLSFVVASRFGYGLPVLAALVFTWVLIAQTFIDIEHQLLFDEFTLPLLWLGLWLSLSQTFSVNPQQSILGAISGYLFLWAIHWGFKLLTRKDGMGYGDFKFLSLFGAWVGYSHLLNVILMASILGSVVGIALIFLFGRNRHQPIPFGPFLAIGGWLTFMGVNPVNQLWAHGGSLG